VKHTQSSEELLALIGGSDVLKNFKLEGEPIKTEELVNDKPVFESLLKMSREEMEGLHLIFKEIISIQD